MNRATAIQQLQERADRWDVLVIGGGATGLGVAVDAASRGFRTALVEQRDFAQATSSRSTKLIHGGFRYLKQGNVSLVRESLRERGLLLRNAPHLVHPLAFLVPAYRWWEKPYYGLGLGVYDLLAGRLGIERSRAVSQAEALRLLPTIASDGLRGGVRYFDGQFDDARLAVSLAQTVFDHGGVAVNYVRVLRLLKANERVGGAVVLDEETGQELELRAKVVVNATGIFTDEVRRLDEREAPPMMTVSQGVHVVLDRSFLPGDCALMVPQTDDGRILFAIPWQGHVLVGTTDTPRAEPCLEPRPLRAELDFLLEHAGRYLNRQPVESDVRAMFAGLRPLAHVGGGNTSKLSRNHVLVVSPSGLVTITGGKWTTYRKMAEDTVNRALEVGGLERKPCRTQDLKLHGALSDADEPVAMAARHLLAYGSRAGDVNRLGMELGLDGKIHPRLSHGMAEVAWAVREEMARSLEDVLSRRLRVLPVDACAAMEAAPAVAAFLARELGWDEATMGQQLAGFQVLAEACLPSDRGVIKGG